ncbi:MAG: hypothetical protein RLZZ399_2428, partial [Verrucomicrobiota bacterium]
MKKCFRKLMSWVGFAVLSLDGLSAVRAESSESEKPLPKL